MTKRLLVGLLLIGLPVTFAEAQPEYKENVEAVIAKLRQQFVAAINARDFEKATAILAADAVILIENREVIEGREGISTMVQQMRERGITPQLTMQTTRFESSGNLAYELGRFAGVRHYPDGSTKTSQGKYVDVWRREPDGQWRIVVHAPSDDPAPQGGAPK